MDQGDESSVRIERLQAAASELETLDEESEIYDRAVAIADDLFSFHAAVMLTDEDGELVPQAALAPEIHVDASFLKADEGIAGKTLATGATHRVQDIANNDDARPMRSSYRSALSLPVGDDGVLQLISTAVGGFTNTDRELAELLVDHVEHGLERVRYEATLERERDRFAALFQNVPDAAVQYSFEDEAPRIEQVNSAFVSRFGFEPETAVGKTTVELLVPEDGRETALERYDEIRNGDRLDVEVKRMTADGPNPFLLRSVPVSTENETQTGYLIYTDIGELKERERQLERKNERLDSFASIVSHDIRNPLSVALGFLDLLETDDEERLEKITSQLERIDRMIDELLSLAREGEMIGKPNQLTSRWRPGPPGNTSTPSTRRLRSPGA